MRREIIETGKTVEEAINSACRKIPCEREDCEWEILDLPRKTFLGLKTIPARVKVWIEEPEKQAPPVRPAAPQPARKQQAPATRPQPVREDRPAAAPPAQQERKPAPAPRPQKEQEAQPKPATPAAAAPRKEEQRPPLEMTPEIQAKCDAAIEYLKGVCAAMGLSPTFNSGVQDGGICIDIQGEGLGAIIGRRGETLDALQYLAGLVANRLEGDYLRLTLDCGDYRTKRRATLEALARKLSNQVLKANVSKTLEPMNPFERRIIHATVSGIEGVSSTSVGEEPNRRVVITSPTARSGRGGGAHRSGGAGAGSGDRRRSGGGHRRPPQRREASRSTQGGTINTMPQAFPESKKNEQTPAAVMPPRNMPEAATATDKPLYTKLDLE